MYKDLINRAVFPMMGWSVHRGPWLACARTPPASRLPCWVRCRKQASPSPEAILLSQTAVLSHRICHLLTPSSQNVTEPQRHREERSEQRRYVSRSPAWAEDRMRGPTCTVTLDLLSWKLRLLTEQRQWYLCLRWL